MRLLGRKSENRGQSPVKSEIPMRIVTTIVLLIGLSACAAPQSAMNRADPPWLAQANSAIPYSPNYCH